MCDNIPDYRLKIERAKTHIQEINALIDAFIKSEPYSIVLDHDTKANQRVWKIRVNKTIPNSWSAIIGDAIHNLRSALDLLMSAVVRHDDPTRISYTHVHFIVRESKEKFEAALPEHIKGASAESIRIVHELKPYKGGSDALWKLHKLDIVDKHQRIIPVGAAHTDVTMVMRMPDFFPEEAGKTMFGLKFTMGKKPQFPLKDGAEVFRAPIDGKIPRDDDVHFSITIAFGEGDILDGEPIVPTLTQLAQFVDSVCDTFERNILYS